MKNELKQEIEKLIDTGIPEVENLKKIYQKSLESITDTQSRIEYLQECLDKGMSKRDAAKALCTFDLRVGQGTAETLVYTVFSGQYQKTQRGKSSRTARPEPVSLPEFVPPSGDLSDEDII